MDVCPATHVKTPKDAYDVVRRKAKDISK